MGLFILYKISFYKKETRSLKLRVCGYVLFEVSLDRNIVYICQQCRSIQNKKA